MRSIIRYAAMGFVLLAHGSAQATLTSGTWVPVNGQTADYCLDTVCSERPLDASIDLRVPGGPALSVMRTEIRFTPAGRDFTWVFGAVFLSEEPPFNLTQTYGSMGDLTYHFESDVALTLTGFVRADYPAIPLLMEVRFNQARFVPIPEPSVAAMVGGGLLILSVRRADLRPHPSMSVPGC